MSMSAQSGRFAEMAALGTAVLWSISAVCWSAAGKRMGALGVSVIRLLLATVMLMAARWAVWGSPLPQEPHDAFWLLVLSGVLGMAAGDLLLFRSFVLIGPRLGMLILSLSPIFVTLIAMAFMHEMVPARALAGIVLTVGGIALVVSEPRRDGVEHGHGRQFIVGVLLCTGSSLLTAIGFVLTRAASKAAGDAFNSYDAATIRVISGTLASCLLVPLAGKLPDVFKGIRDRKAMLAVVIGVVVGPVLGVWLSMIAFGGLQAGIATALINTSPIVMIPIGYLAYRDRPSLRAIAGTIVAVAGVFMLMWGKA